MASIGTFCGGLPEIIDDGKTGMLVAQRNVDTLAECMDALANDYGLRTRMGSAARVKMENDYDTVRQNARLEEIFDATLRGQA
jgi:colanic acid/amylovoran biosynthesis glycosyltransferase